MPPKATITKSMIIDAAFDIARNDGADNINARAVAKKLNCSTQPIMYHFKTIEELKKAVYEKADNYHSEYLMNIHGNSTGPMLGIGLNYIRFSVEERCLFKFLFQSNYLKEKSLTEMINAQELKPVISAMQAAIKVSEEKVKEIFLTIFLFAHGYASIIANNSLKYEEKQIMIDLERAYNSAILYVRGI